MATTFSTVIATRNRQAALALSLPLHLTQSRLPERILVVDSSDDMAGNKALVDRLAATAPIPVEHLPSAAGSSLQRNIGLARIASDVVFFPDDDSLVHPEALAGMMRIYDCDTNGRIGGVCGMESKIAPEGVLPQSEVVYEKRIADRLRTRFGARPFIEDRFFPDPMRTAARTLQKALPPAEDWLAQENAEWVEWMTGFRMSFRTEVIRKRGGFNELLGRYSLFEDIDAALGVLGGGHSLVAARDAQIYHHRSPEKRTGGFQLGVINILNRAYVALRSGAADARLKVDIRRYSQFRTAQLLAGTTNKHGRDRVAGARAACRVLPALIASDLKDIDEVYLALRQKCLTLASAQSKHRMDVQGTEEERKQKIG